jgi:hypothetical protein
LRQTRENKDKRRKIREIVKKIKMETSVGYGSRRWLRTKAGAVTKIWEVARATKRPIPSIDLFNKIKYKNPIRKAI